MGILLPAPRTLERSLASNPVPRLILAVDVEGSTLRTNLAKGELRLVMYTLLDRALRATDIERTHLEVPIDRGDGVLLLIRPNDEVPKVLLLGRLIPKLAALLIEHNAAIVQPDLRLRLRAVFHAGEVHDDGWGFYGEDLDVAFRLLDSPAVKKTLKDTPAAPLVLVVSDEIYSATIRHGYVDSTPYEKSVYVRVANRRRRGWVRILIPAREEQALLITQEAGPSSLLPLTIASQQPGVAVSDGLSLVIGPVAR